MSFEAYFLVYLYEKKGESGVMEGEKAGDAIAGYRF